MPKPSNRPARCSGAEGLGRMSDRSLVLCPVPLVNSLLCQMAWLRPWALAAAIRLVVETAGIPVSPRIPLAREPDPPPQAHAEPGARAASRRSRLALFPLRAASYRLGRRGDHARGHPGDRGLRRLRCSPARSQHDGSNEGGLTHSHPCGISFQRRCFTIKPFRESCRASSARSAGKAKAPRRGSAAST